VLIAAALASSVAGAATNSGASSAERRFAALEKSYVVYFFQHYPVVGTFLGASSLDASLADVDAGLRDYRPEAIAGEDAELLAYLHSFEALDGTTLAPAQRVDRAVALSQIRFLRHLHRVRRHQEVSLDSYVEEPFRGVEWQLQGMEVRADGTLGSHADWLRLIRRLRAVPVYLQVAERQLRLGIQRGHTPDQRVLSAYGLEIAAADEAYFRNSLASFALSRMPPDAAHSLAPELETATHGAADAYAALGRFVRSTYFASVPVSAQPIAKPAYARDRYPLGRAEYDWALRNNFHLRATAASLMAGAMEPVETTGRAIAALAGEIAIRHGWPVPSTPEATVRSVLDQLATDGPPTDEAARRWYVEATDRLVRYARRTGLFDPDPDYALEVTLTPPTLRGSVDDAAYYAAPPLKGPGSGRFYVTGADDNPTKLREAHNRSAIAVLAAHEGFPGHDWYYRTASRAGISPIRWLTPGAKEDSSSMWQESLPSEGWALYAEALLAEPQAGAPEGFYQPEERLAQLRAKLYRDLRVFIDPALHTGKLGFNDAVDLFSRTVDFLPGPCSPVAADASAAKRASCETAARAIFRYSRWPTQAIAYRVGREEIYTLRHRSQERLGTSFSLQEFHSAFIQQGPIPPNYLDEGGAK
jgi:uncharacterized protein (DUF885 family)